MAGEIPGGKLYFRPTGLVYGDAAELAVTEQHAAWLAGGRVAFTLMEIVDREGADITSIYCPYSNLRQSSDSTVVDAIARLTAPRAPVAGLSMARSHIMGIVNVTPDSFSDGGLYDTASAAIAHAGQLVAEGASIIDVGGESTRPGAQAVAEEEERARVLPVLEGLRGLDAVLSLDTRKAGVMAAGIAAGAQMLNDVSALTYDADSLATARDSGLPIVLMHAQGTPENMQDDPRYDHVLYEVYDELAERIAVCEAAGIERTRLLVDPGIGFGKRREHNLALFAGLSLFHGLGVPVLVGASRKSFIGALTDEPEPRHRVPGSVAAALAAFSQGVQILRCHDVAQTRQALVTWQACMSGQAAPGMGLAVPGAQGRDAAPQASAPADDA